ncbi:hypothetical protein HOD88_02420 [archaeon]|jgi:hypothetical protein|nr:hypothetical protein [archaeon]
MRNNQEEIFKKISHSSVREWLNRKRGEILVNETLKIILSVIAIGFLVFFLTSLYFAKIYDESFIAAQNTAEQIDLVVKAGGGEVDALTPKGWSIFSFVRRDRPNSCSGKSCLCLCDDVPKVQFWKNQLDECNKKGVCLIVDGLIEFDEIKIKKELTSIEISEKGGQVSVLEK